MRIVAYTRPEVHSTLFPLAAFLTSACEKNKVPFFLEYPSIRLFAMKLLLRTVVERRCAGEVLLPINSNCSLKLWVTSSLTIDELQENLIPEKLVALYRFLPIKMNLAFFTLRFFHDSIPEQRDLVLRLNESKSLHISND
jgi:hypothetical protein